MYTFHATRTVVPGVPNSAAASTQMGFPVFDLFYVYYVFGYHL
jgi:hypothetical protein